MVNFLKREGAPTLAYVKTEASEKGKKLPTILFLGGFRSDMQGSKATYLEALAKKRGQAYIRFDYRGHGQSEGVFDKACISDWAQDATDIIDHCINGQILLVGSSMGGWISLLAALKQPERIHSIVGLASAPDFTKWIEEGMNETQKNDIAHKGFFELPNDYDDAPYIITQKLIDDGRTQWLLNDKIAITAPVRLIQGKKDADVPWETANIIKSKLESNDVETIFIEDADHRLSSDEQLQIINAEIEKLL